MDFNCAGAGFFDAFSICLFWITAGILAFAAFFGSALIVVDCVALAARCVRRLFRRRG